MARGVLGVLGVVGAILCIGYCAEQNPIAPKSTAEAKQDFCTGKDGKILAYRASQEFVTRRLKAPSTAVFPSDLTSSDIRVLASGDCDFTVAAYVDAQNGFGAQIRTPYLATLSYNFPTQEWTAKDIELLQ